jgi:ubiquitin
VELLRAQGWVLEKGGSTAWHAQAKAPDKLFAEEAPNKCPACGANTNPLIRVEASNFAVRCHFCGAWGCRNCAHFHDENKKATNKAIQRPLLGGPKVYAGAPWIHNQCCKCGFKLGLLQKFS